MHFPASPLFCRLLATTLLIPSVFSNPLPAPIANDVATPIAPSVVSHIPGPAVYHEPHLPRPTPAPAGANTTVIEDLEERGLAKRSYVGTCNPCITNGVNLQCGCRNEGGGLTNTFIALNECLVNNNGVLQWRRNGGFGGSCRYIGSDLGSSYFPVSCRDAGGNWRDSAVNLNDRIHNYNGRLGCDVPN